MLIDCVSRRSPVSNSLGKACAANCMATCSCLDAACSSAALADSTASNPIKSCSTAYDMAPAAAAYPAAACVNQQLAQPISTSTCGDHVTTCSHTARSGTANALHGGECHVHAITTRTWHARCSPMKKQPVRTFSPLWQACAFFLVSHGALGCTSEGLINLFIVCQEQSQYILPAKHMFYIEVCVQRMFACKGVKVCLAACRSTSAIVRCCSKA